MERDGDTTGEPEAVRQLYASGQRRRRSRSEATGSQRLVYSRIALAILSIVPPHLLGGVFAWGTLCIAIVSCIALAVVLWEVRNVDAAACGRDSTVTILAFMLLATVAQAVPLPISWVTVLAPESAGNSTATAEALDLSPPQWAPLSLSPGNTYERVLFAFAVAAAFCTARIVVKRSRPTLVLMFVALGVASVALSQLIHHAADSTLIYGLYRPFAHHATGPLINPNNLAGFMAMGLPLCLGLALRRKQPQTLAWLLAAGLIALVALLARSRGGVVALVAGPLCFSALLWHRTRWGTGHLTMPRARRTRWSRLLMELGVAGIGLLVVGYGLVLLADHDVLESNYQDFSKLDLFVTEASMLVDSPRRMLLGVGRGAFGQSFTNHGTASRAHYAECLPLQYAIDFGIPVASMLLLCGLARFRQTFGRWQSPAELGALVGLAAIGLQNLVDFSLELSGIAVPAAICLAAGLPPAAAGGGRFSVQAHLKAAAIYLVPIGVGLLLVFGAPAFRGDLLVRERELEADFNARRLPEFWARFRQTVPLHPAEASLALLGAAQLVSEGAGRAPLWLNRAMNLAPGWAAPHLWAARWLAARKRWDQAKIELRFAAETAPGQAADLLCTWLTYEPSADMVLSVAPEAGPNRFFVLDRGSACLYGGAPLESMRVDRIIHQQVPHAERAGVRNVLRSLRAGNFAAAVSEARELESHHPQVAELYLLHAEALAGLSQRELAVQVLASAPAGVNDRRAILRALALAYVDAGDSVAMRNTIDRLRMESGGDPAQLASAMLLLASCEAGAGNSARAMRALREAALMESGADHLESAARLATQLGQFSYALSVWAQLCAQHADVSDYCAQRDRLAERANAP